MRVATVHPAQAVRSEGRVDVVHAQTTCKLRPDSCRHSVCVSSLDQSVFLGVESSRAHSLFRDESRKDFVIHTLHQSAIFDANVTKGLKAEFAGRCG